MTDNTVATANGLATFRCAECEPGESHPRPVCPQHGPIVNQLEMGKRTYFECTCGYEATYRTQDDHLPL